MSTTPIMVLSSHVETCVSSRSVISIIECREEVKKCVIIPRKGDIYKSSKLGLEIEIPKVALRNTLFFVCRKIPATCNSVDFGKYMETTD